MSDYRLALTDATNQPRCALAFDVGTKRTGIAVGNSLTQTARALEVIEHRDSASDWLRIDRLCQQYRPDVCVVGEPLTWDGEVQPATERARTFAKTLRQRLGLPVVLVDERSSSKEADQRFANARAQGTAKRRDAALQDAIAAQIILERWLLAGMPIPA